MNRTLLQEPSVKPMGWMDVYSDGKHRVFKSCGTPLGFYKPTSDTTHYINGSMVGRGDLLTLLLR